MRVGKALEGSIILLTFAFLWVPLGQHDFLYTHWMKIGTFMMPFLMFVALSFGGQHSAKSPGSAKLIALLLLCGYFTHQFEEHWVDVFGNHYAFQASINELVREVLATSDKQAGPLSVEAIFVINTALVWLVGAIAIWRAPEQVFPTAAMAAIVLVNGIAHIVPAVALARYNPGLLTSIVIFLPGGLLAFRYLDVDRKLVASSLAWAVFAHMIMVFGMMASTWWGLVPPIAYYTALVACSVLPAFINTPVHRG